MQQTRTYAHARISALILALLPTLFLPLRASAQTSLPSPWLSQDIGNPAIAGSSTYSSGVFTIKAAGADIWGTSDQFRFLYRTMTGDGEVIARVDSVTAAAAWSKAGVMIRETLSASSKHELALVSAGRGVALQRRVSTGGTSYNTAGTTSTAPRWVRLVRKGSSFTAYESADGQTWRTIGSSTNSMASTVYVGLAATSHNTSATTTAKISNVTVKLATSNQLPSVSLTSPANGATYTAPATVPLAASASDADGTISKVEFYRGSTLIGTDTTSPYSYSWSNVAAGSYTLTAVATDNLGGRTTSAARTITVSTTTGAVPAPWAAQDIGSPAISGSASESSGTFTVKGAGTDIWGTADQFQFVYQLLTGDGEIKARVQSLAVVNAWSKAGVMMRETLSAGSKHASMFASGSNGMAFQRRASTGGTSVHTYGTAVNAPYWVRVVRAGDVFTAYDSPDGQSWKQIGSQTISMLQTIYVGLAVTSHDTSATTTAAISSVTVTGGGSSTNQAPSVTLTSPANGATYTAPATVTLAANASDSDGTVSRVDFYRGSTLIGSDTSSPYSVSWSSVAAGSYTLTAVATDNDGASKTSSAVSITVNSTSNAPPTVAITNPASGSSFAAPTTIPITASASDSNGTVAKVDFYAGTTLIGSDTTSPYTVNWANAAPGTYSITARATDNGGAVTTSAAVSITLRPTEAVFTPSADNSTVTSYRLDIFLSGADPATATPKATQNLGKPAIVNNTMTVDITSTIQPLAAGTYFATVTAISSGGSSRSAPSANFNR